jgi:hypothetical protein
VHNKIKLGNEEKLSFQNGEEIISMMTYWWIGLHIKTDISAAFKLSYWLEHGNTYVYLFAHAILCCDCNSLEFWTN